jgi:hypothetical protein
MGAIESVGQEMEIRLRMLWSAAAERGADAAFERHGIGSRRKSGVALRFPPHSKVTDDSNRTPDQ